MITDIHRWSTTSQPRDAAYTAWGEAVDEYFHHYHFRSQEPDRFRGAFVRRGIGSLALTSFHITQSEANYAPDDKVVDQHRFELKYISRGRATLFSSVGEEPLLEGALVLTDHAEPFRFATQGGVECASLSLPNKWLDRAVPNAVDRSFRAFDVGAPWTRALGSIVSELASLPAGDHQIPEALVADNISGLLELMFGSTPLEGTAHQHQRARTIIRDIAARYDDPELRVEHVAQSCRISTRHLHGVLSAIGTSFGKELVRIRLAHARRMLESPGCHGMQISQIAYRCGFNDAAHFSRRFAQVYGVSPTQARRGVWTREG